MPVYLPDCLDINPEEYLTGCSLSLPEYLKEIAGDYPIIKEDNIPEDGEKKGVYLLIYSSDQSLNFTQKILSNLVNKNLRKVYVVIYAKKGFSVLRLIKRCLEIHVNFISKFEVPAPTLISKDSKVVLELKFMPDYRMSFFNIPFSEIFKPFPRHWLKLIRIFSTTKYIVVDVSACLS